MEITQYIIFGIKPLDKPLILPQGVIKYKIKQRNNSFATIFLKYSDRIEKWMLAEEDDSIILCYMQASNNRNG